jgi:hypothetical protein
MGGHRAVRERALNMSEHRILSKGAVAILVAIAACVAIAVPAYATWTDTHDNTITLAGTLGPRGNIFGVVTADCPAGEEAAAGGIAAAVRLPPYAHELVFPRAMFLNSTQTGWIVAGENLGATAGTLTAHVYCDKHPVFMVVSKKVTAVLGQKTTAIATCPANTFVLSAGFSVPALASTAAVTHLRATAGKVTATIVVVYAGPTTLKVYAYCGPGPRATETAAATVSVPAGVRTVVATCPSGEHFLFGGFDGAFTTPLQPAPQVVPVSMSSPSIGKWQVSGFDGVTNNPQPGAGRLTAYAYCR